MRDEESDPAEPAPSGPADAFAAGEAHDEHDEADGRDGAEDDEEAIDDPAGLVARVRFGLGKELQLYPDTFVVVQHEARDELRLHLDSLKRMTLAPGDPVPSKLVLLFDLDDGTTIIAAEGMSNARDFRKLLARLVEIKPDLELDPPNMDEQLTQALDIRRRGLLGCYGFIAVTCVLVWVVYLVVAFIGAHAH